MNAQQLKNSILQEAIMGKLVPQDPNDEPASVLLDKIREEKKRLVKEGKLKKKDLEETPISEDEKPFEIPESWEWCKLGWIGNWGAGATPAKGIPEFYMNGTIPWLRTGELNNGIVYDSEIKVTPYALQKCSLRECQVGDVLIAMYGATIGKVAIAGIELTTNQACCACTPYQIYNKYLLYYLMASKQRFIDLGEGGAQPNISREKIIAFPFPLPPLAEQQRIVAKIEELLPKVEEYGKAQESLNKLNEELPERLKKSILQEAIEGRLVPQDPNDEPASVLLDKIRAEKKRLVKEGKLKKKDLEETPISEDEIPFEIPKSWEWCRLLTLCKTIHYGYTASAAPAGNSRLLRITDIQEDKVNWPSVPFCSIKEKDLETYQLRNRDILIARTGGTVGKTYIVRGLNEIAVFASYLIRAIPLDSIFEEYVKLFMGSPYYWSQLTYAATGTGQPNVNGQSLSKLIVPLPPLAEQKRIVSKIEELFHEIDKLKI